MIKVTIELFPTSRPGAKKTLGVLSITNDETGTEEIGNYDISLMTFRRGFKEYAGRIEGFERKGAKVLDLIGRAIKSIKPIKENK